MRAVYDNGTVGETTPIGESCSGNTEDLEKCERPIIKECVDRNKYCTGPPVVILQIKTFPFIEKFLFNMVSQCYNITILFIRNLTQLERK